MAAVTTAQEFTAGFKRVFKHDMKLADKDLKQARRRIRQSGFFVLEWTQIEQRLRSLRYQKLSKKTWRDCNNVYFALSIVDDVTYKQKSLACLLPNIGASGEAGSKAPKLSAVEIYLLVQLFGVIDANAMSLQGLMIAENYIKQFLPELCCEVHDDNDTCNDCIFVALDQQQPPLVAKVNEHSELVHAIDVGNFKSHLKTEYQQLLNQFRGEQQQSDSDNQDAGQTKPDMANAEDIERLLALRNMLNRLHGRERGDTRKYKDHEEDIFVFNGFTTSFNLLVTKDVATDQEDVLASQLNDALAQRSAVMADTGTSEDATRWLIVNESKDGLLLRTKDTQYIKNLFVGQLTAYAPSKQELKRPSIGYIVRIVRTDESNIEISLKILSSQIGGTAVQNRFLQKNSMGLPGILIFDTGPGKQLQLLLHQSHKLSTGTAVTIQKSGQSYEHAIGKADIIQREFVVYNLDEVCM